MFVISAFYTLFSFLSCLFSFCSLSSLQAVGYFEISIGLKPENLTGVSDLVSISFEVMDKLLSILVLQYFHL